MEEEPQNDNNTVQYDTSFTPTSNWTVADGCCLSDSVTFESSLSLRYSDSDADDSTPHISPLILHPPSPDPSPCEITISFARKHEVRQVYVRSTARVYEIYYAAELCRSKEYLCTVRCGVATRDDEVLRVQNVEEAGSGNFKGGGEEGDGKKSRSDSGSSTNEDGWVEVKSVDSPLCDGGKIPVPSSFSARLEGSAQDLYEATAEISDAEPCMSITLRLLSLQNKGCVFVDEIFVFGDPVEPHDSENEVGQMENPAGSSLMAMFMPTLLQLSRTRNAGQMQDDYSCDTSEKEKSLRISSEATDSTYVANNVQQEGQSGLADMLKVEMQETDACASIPTQVEMPPQVPATESKPDLSCSRIEKVLDQLVSRVSRVEDLFLRFEECMVKPISSIEARLQQIEQQLEELTKKPQNPGLLHGTRISAPEFSCHEPDNFIYKNGNTVAESDDVKECHSYIPPDDTADLGNSYQSRSCLMVTAPEFSNADDEKENNPLDEKGNDVPEAVTLSSEYRTRKAFSVDDALASALAGFLCSASPEPQKYTQALAIKAPDFSGEEDSFNSGKEASTEVEGFCANSPPICLSATEESECINDYSSASTDTFYLESKVEAITSDDHLSEKTGEGVDDLCHNEEGNGDSQDRGIHYTVAPAVQKVAETDLYQQITEDITIVKPNDEVSNCSVIGKCEMPKDFPENQSTDGSDTTQEGAVVSFEFSAATEVTEEKSNKEYLENVFEYPRTSSAVNFEMPILDVKFDSLGSSNSNYLLEVLLDELSESKTVESNVEAPRAKENNGGSQIGQQSNLISVDDLDLASATSGNCFSVDVDYCSLVETPLNVESNELQDCCSCNGKEAGTESLI